MMKKGVLLFFLLVLASAAAADTNTTLPNITLVSPQYGVSNRDTFELKIRTTEPAVCKYSNSASVPYDDIQSQRNYFSSPDGGLTHVIANFTDLDNTDNYRKTIYVKCRSGMGQTNEENPFAVDLMVDTTPPVLRSVVPEPAHVIEKVEVFLKAEADDMVSCRFDDRETRYPLMKFEFSIPSQFNATNRVRLGQDTIPQLKDMGSYSFFVGCVNRAGDYSAASQVNFSVDLSVANQIIMLSPSGYNNGKNITLRVNTNKKSTCFYSESYVLEFPQQDSLEHYMSVSDLKQGENVFPVKCVYSLGGLDGFGEISFKVDSDPPDNLTIDAPEYYCDNQNFAAYFDAQDESGIAYFEYAIGGTENSSHWERTGEKAVADFDYEAGKEYTWKVRATDKAGNTGEEESRSFVIYDGNNTNCRKKIPPIVSVRENETALGTFVSILCTDPDGLCTAITYCIVSSPAECSNCTYMPYYGQMTLRERATVCGSATDNDNNTMKSSRSINVSVKCASTADSCCNNAYDSTCDPDCPTYEDPDCSSTPLPVADKDEDGIPDDWETMYSMDPENSSDALLDKDLDNLTNIDEYRQGTNPNEMDTDGDSYSDSEEVSKGSDPTSKSSVPKAVVPKVTDTDKDGINDEDEKKCGLDMNTEDSLSDADNDGLTNKEECLTYRTKFDERDTDSDGVPDGEEVLKNTDPLDAESYPRSHMLNYVLFIAGSILIVAGAAVMLMQKHAPPEARVPAPAAMQTQPQFSAATRAEPRASVAKARPANSQRRPVNADELEKKIYERREIIKKNKRNQVFDEFDEEPMELSKLEPEEVKPKPVVLPPRKKTVFDRLGDIVKGKTFNKLDSITEKNIKEQDDIDSIIEKSTVKQKAVEEKLERLGQK